MRRAQIQVFRHLAAGKTSFACNFLAACVTHRSMRNWMRERMKRRKKKPENETEATGKVGQQKPLVDESHLNPLFHPTVIGNRNPSVRMKLPRKSRRLTSRAWKLRYNRNHPQC